MSEPTTKAMQEARAFVRIWHLPESHITNLAVAFDVARADQRKQDAKIAYDAAKEFARHDSLWLKACDEIAGIIREPEASSWSNDEIVLRAILETIEIIEREVIGEGCKTPDYEEFRDDPETRITPDINDPARCYACAGAQVVRWLRDYLALADEDKATSCLF